MTVLQRKIERSTLEIKVKLLIKRRVNSFEKLNNIVFKYKNAKAFN